MRGILSSHGCHNKEAPVKNVGGVGGINEACETG